MVLIFRTSYSLSASPMPTSSLTPGGEFGVPKVAQLGVNICGLVLRVCQEVR